MKFTIILLVFVVNIFAVTAEPSNSANTTTKKLKEQEVFLIGDSTEIYKNLIATEAAESNSIPSIVGITTGSVISLGGLFFTGFSVYAMCFEEGFTAGVAAAGTLLVATPLLIIGVPMLAYSIYYYKKTKKHYYQMKEYEKSFESYQERLAQEKQNSEHTVEWMVLPTLNIANASGGLNLFLTF